MKKITKKSIKEAPKYMVAIDWCAGKAPNNECFGYRMLNADNIFDAMDQAESYFTDDVYMTFLLEKTEDQADLGILYGAVMASRAKGNFHRADRAHSESGFWATYNPNWNYGECNYYGTER